MMRIVGPAAAAIQHYMQQSTYHRQLGTLCLPMGSTSSSYWPNRSFCMERKMQASTKGADVPDRDLHG